jgi:hypothetical protein
MTTKVTPTGAFLRDLKRLGKGARRNDAIIAIELFVENPHAASLNFEPIRSQKATIQSARIITTALFCG